MPRISSKFEGKFHSRHSITAWFLITHGKEKFGERGRGGGGDLQILMHRRDLQNTGHSHMSNELHE